MYFTVITRTKRAREKDIESIYRTGERPLVTVWKIKKSGGVNSDNLYINICHHFSNDLIFDKETMVFDFDVLGVTFLLFVMLSTF